MPLDLTEVLPRIGMAFLSGLVLGVERESHGRAAGLRTTVLVCLAATLAGILSDRFYTGSFGGALQSPSWHPDPARLGAGLLTGIGFLGAGVILRQGNLVRGVTTASMIWFTTILGLCYGTGNLLLGLIGLMLALVTVFCLRPIEIRIKRDFYATVSVTTTLDGVPVDEVARVLREFQLVINHVEFNQDVINKTCTMRFALRFKKGEQIDLPERVGTRLMQARGVTNVDWK